MSARRGGLIALGAMAAGALAGAAAEEFLFRRTFRRDDRERGERFGTVRGKPAEVESFDGTRLHAELYGPDGESACVFLHGFTLTRDAWHYQLRDLDDRRLIAFDARGHGGSGPARGPRGHTVYTASTLARDVHAVLDQTGTRSAVLVGHSMGGMTILQFAEDFPEELGRRVKGIVLLNTTFTSQLGAWREDRPRYEAVRKTLGGLLEWFAADPRRVNYARMRANDLTMFLTRIGFGSHPSASHVAWTRRMIDSTQSDTLAAAMVGLESYDTLRVLEKIDVPALIVGGEKDLISPAWLSREMAERIAGARLVILPGAGHMGMLERHAELSQRMESFLSEVLA